MSETLPIIKAVIYDVDGTMVDSEPIHVAAWNEALEMQGSTLADLPLEFQATMAGKKPIVIAEGMVKELRLTQSAIELLEVKSALFQDKARTELTGMPGVAESVSRLSDDGYELAIGTSLHRDYVDMILAKLGLTGLFKVIVTGDQIKNGKPHPETYLTVASNLRLQPDECVVLEDATSGIQSAKSAGAWCIAVENLNAVPQDTNLADSVVHTLNEVTKNLINQVVSTRV